MNFVRSYDDGSLPWPGIMFGLTISSVWYWCSDQVGETEKNAAHDFGTLRNTYPIYLTAFVVDDERSSRVKTLNELNPV